MYKSLNDAGSVVSKEFFAPGEVKIWYMKPDFFRELIFGDRSCVNVDDLSKSHVLLGEIAGSALHEEIFCNMQGEIWSPQGEARDLIISKGLQHTSMSCGDIIQIGNKVYIAASFGFDLIKG